MARHIAVGIDIGSYQIKVVVAENDPQTNIPKIIGTGIAESKGLRHGYIINSNEVVKSIKKAVAQAEKASGIQIRKAYLAIGGVGLNANVSSTHVATNDSAVCLVSSLPSFVLKK